MPRAIVVGFALLVLGAGCGSDDDAGSGGGGGPPQPPVLEGVMPMAPAGLHVSWKNVSGDCDSVEAERMTATAAWAVVFSVPGSIDNKHDGSATEKVEHTYRLRCVKGAQYSAYSNEMSGTPQ